MKALAAQRQEAATRSLGIDDSTPAFRVPKTAELVARDLRNRIVRGELSENETLPAETELMAQFSISRPTLREALRILESESLLTVTRGSREGPRVNRPDPRIAARHFGQVLQSRGTTLEDILNVRALIEPAVARVLALGGPAHKVRTLRAIVDEQRCEPPDFAAASRTSLRFHKVLVELAGNQALVLFVAMANHIFERHISTAALSTSIAKLDSAREESIAANGKLVDLIEQGEADEAERFWRDYLEDRCKLMRRVYPLKNSIDMLD